MKPFFSLSFFLWLAVYVQEVLDKNLFDKLSVLQDLMMIDQINYFPYKLTSPLSKNTQPAMLEENCPYLSDCSIFSLSLYTTGHTSLLYPL